MVPKLELAGIRKQFSFAGKTLPVLEGVDLSVEEGEFVSVIGPSGCGKSTLLNIMAGLEEPDQGTLCMDGADAAGRLGKVGYMPQKDLLLPWRNVLDNTILGPELQGVSRSRARQQALGLMERFGLKGFEGHYPFLLSGGMRQRAALLRTVLAGRDVILLDEPFGALDALTRSRLQEWLLELWSGLGKTMVLVTHDVDEATLLSDRVYVLTARPGRVKMVMPVALPRPRTLDMVTQPAFLSLKASLMTALREEDLRAQEEPWR
ncbi:MAG: ABC transporter ATP-binding protein [Chloroflexi bacterium]|nr:ABC transporter ATP-binding protein [Chloroflexota bacterium]